MIFQMQRKVHTSEQEGLDTEQTEAQLKQIRWAAVDGRITDTELYTGLILFFFIYTFTTTAPDTATRVTTTAATANTTTTLLFYCSFYFILLYLVGLDWCN